MSDSSSESDTVMVDSVDDVVEADHVRDLMDSKCVYFSCASIIRTRADMSRI